LSDQQIATIVKWVDDGASYVPEHRTRLQLFSAYRTNADLDIPPNSLAQTQAFHVLNEVDPIGWTKFRPFLDGAAG